MRVKIICYTGINVPAEKKSLTLRPTITTFCKYELCKNKIKLNY